MLRGAFGLSRATAEPSGDLWDIRRRSRFLIISRKNSRAFRNERAMADMAMSLGYDVRVGEPDSNTDVSKFARLVNSADVMVGVHGAGLTNMLFLPAGAVLIQVVPYGGLEWLARGTSILANPSMPYSGIASPPRKFLVSTRLVRLGKRCSIFNADVTLEKPLPVRDRKESDGKARRERFHQRCPRAEVVR
ncbi:putative glycosyltransferase AGO61 [Hordeum vulgare]|nr:putative glycosyltransferase AGO61 [Hordeum vulgare]